MSMPPHEFCRTQSDASTHENPGAQSPSPMHVTTRQVGGPWHSIGIVPAMQSVGGGESASAETEEANANEHKREARNRMSES
jgi:hypothetical protein